MNIIKHDTKLRGVSTHTKPKHDDKEPEFLCDLEFCLDLPVEIWGWKDMSADDEVIG